MSFKFIGRLGVTALTAVLFIGQTAFAGYDLKTEAASTKNIFDMAQVNFDVVPAAETTENTTNVSAENTDATAKEQVNIDISNDAVAGMALTVTDFYDAVYNDAVSDTLALELEAIVSEETAGKLEALQAYNNPGIATVKNYLNVRDKADVSGKIIGKMVGKSVCEIIDGKDGWYHIKSGRVEGYVSAEYIATGDDAKKLAVDAAKARVIVKTDVLNVREEPNTECNVVERVGNDEKYSVLENNGEWIKISLDGTDGYVSSEFVDVKYAFLEAVEFTPEVPKAEETKPAEANGSGANKTPAPAPAPAQSSVRSQIVNYAVQFLGNPYVWGGTSLTNGCDCSGFTMQIYKKFGVRLSHSSRAQANEGRAIDGSQLRPGDLIFYGAGTINHVAMYIGNGQIIHASDETTGIIISRYNNRTPVKCVNVLGD
ncbi:MAG: C40 family peptidase [Lachnospiraceae bacterium]|nr:C40 family peptidase [Lachnospiraceae bacterium]